MGPFKVQGIQILRSSLLQEEGIYPRDPDRTWGQARFKVEESNGEFDTRAKCLSPPKLGQSDKKGKITQRQILRMGKGE